MNMWQSRGGVPCVDGKACNGVAPRSPAHISRNGNTPRGTPGQGGDSDRDGIWGQTLFLSFENEVAEKKNEVCPYLNIVPGSQSASCGQAITIPRQTKIRIT
jgi:hypothetical protein